VYTVRCETSLGTSIVSGRGRIAYIERHESSDGAERFHLGVEFTLLSDRSRDRLEGYIVTLIAMDEEETA
jgi:hypothetical protein